MNVQHCQDRLLELETVLSARTGRAIADGRREFAIPQMTSPRRVSPTKWRRSR
jgi:hypothetical protein